MPSFLKLLASSWMMIPIAIASLAAVALIIEQVLASRRAKAHLDLLWNRPEQRTSLLAKKPGDVVLQFLVEVEEGKVKAGHDQAELAGQLILAQERRISWLGTIASIAPLLGLLGTVSGMITIFFRIAAAPPNNPLQDLSAGISEALVATAGGLVVAIIAALGQHFLMNANDDLAVDMEAWIKDQAAPPPTAASHPGIPAAPVALP